MKFKKHIATAALLLTLPLVAGCITARKTEPVKETKVIVVPDKKKPQGRKAKNDKIAICHKGKTKMIKKKHLDDYLKKGAILGSCK